MLRSLHKLVKLFLFLSLSFPAAEAKDVRSEVLSAGVFIYDFCSRLESLRAAQVDCGNLRKMMDAVGTGDRILIQDQVSLSDGLPRSGVNRPWIPDISISSEFWEAASGDPARQVAFLLHEYLGLMGLEGTDDYRISYTALQELRRLISEVGITHSFFQPIDLYAPQSNGPQSCINISGLWRYVSKGKLGEVGLLLSQIGCESVTSRLVMVSGKKSYKLSVLQDTDDKILIGGQRERSQNGAKNIYAPMDNVVFYSAFFKENTFVDRQFHPLNPHCKETTEIFSLKSKNSLVVEKTNNCVDGRKIKTISEYRRVY